MKRIIGRRKHPASEADHVGLAARLSYEETKNSLKKRLNVPTFREFAGEVQAKKTISSKKKPTKQYVIPAGKHPLDAKLVHFFNKNKNIKYKTKSEFIRDFNPAKIPISACEARLWILIRAGMIPDFAQRQITSRFGVTKAQRVQIHLKSVKKEIAARSELTNNPFYKQARQFGNASLIEAYRKELANPVPSKENIRQIETMFNALNSKYDLNWLRARATVK